MKKRRHFLFSLIIIIPAGVVILGLIRFTPTSPHEEMQYAREVLATANKNQAATYSIKLYNEAKIFYDSALVNWQRENKRFIYFRNFDNVSMYAKLSAEKAVKASSNSEMVYSELKIKDQERIDSLNKLIIHINRLFASYPLATEIRNRISKGKLLLKEAEVDFLNGYYLQANLKISDAESLITRSYESSVENLKFYFQSYPVWKKWVNNTLKESKMKQDYSIIIDKVARKLYVYHKGQKKYEFNAELGKNWVGHKKMSGDYATPEGRYYITRKIGPGNTKYYRALLINYPNEADKTNFKKEVAMGNLPSSARIGGLIEIHGKGGRGTDWTEGCIALTDSEMDVIFKIVGVGTPVTIVGSTVDFESVHNR